MSNPKLPAKVKISLRKVHSDQQVQQQRVSTTKPSDTSEFRAVWATDPTTTSTITQPPVNVAAMRSSRSTRTTTTPTTETTSQQSIKTQRKSSQQQPPVNNAAETRSVIRGGRRTAGKTTNPSQQSRNSMDERASLQWVNTTSTSEQNPLQFLASRGYQTTRLLGEGGFAKVYEARYTATDASAVSGRVAIKMFDLTNADQAYWIAKCLRNEMYVSKNMKHPNIVMTYEVIKTHRNGFIVMDFAAHGTMEHMLYETRRAPYGQNECKRQFGALTAGLRYMHRSNVAHRDLKLENFLLAGDDTPMISDFGFAALGSKQSATVLTRVMRRTPCGTCGYMAPELYRKQGRVGYDSKAVDIYALGVCLYEMLNLAKPYPVDQSEQTVNRIINQELRWRVELSGDNQDLIKNMLQIDPTRRPNIDQVIESKWLNPDTVTAVLNFFGLRG